MSPTYATSTVDAVCEGLRTHLKTQRNPELPILFNRIDLETRRIALPFDLEIELRELSKSTIETVIRKPTN